MCMRVYMCVRVHVAANVAATFCPFSLPYTRRPPLFTSAYVSLPARCCSNGHYRAGGSERPLNTTRTVEFRGLSG